MTFSTWSQTAASNTAVGGISTDGNVTLVNQIDNMFRGMMAELAVARDDGTVSATAVRGYLHGLTLSNNTGDATNDIDIAVGECATSDSPYWKMALASTLTKRLDANWAVGTNQGGLDTGAIANTTYHIWLIQRSDTLVVDALFSTSATSPTMPANYDRKRRIGSIMRETAVIVPFRQDGDIFKRVNAGGVVNRNSTAAAAAALLSLSVPTGISVAPLMTLAIGTAVSSSIEVNVGSATETTALVRILTATSNASEQTVMSNTTPPIVFTNTSGQIMFSTVINSGSISFNTLTTFGWVDTRGRV